METFTVVPGCSNRLSSIVGARKNAHHSGSTSSTSLMECSKSTLKDCPLLATVDKHDMMGSARVKDESRVNADAKGVLIAMMLIRMPYPSSI